MISEDAVHLDLLLAETPDVDQDPTVEGVAEASEDRGDQWYPRLARIHRDDQALRSHRPLDVLLGLGLLVLDAVERVDQTAIRLREPTGPAG